MPDEPVVSIIIPVRYGMPHLPDAVDSVLAQTLTAWEAVIIDDGSSDATPAVLKSYAERDPRIRVLTQPPVGIVAALNRGLEAARAPLVARMDADDIALPDRLARQVAALAAMPAVAVLGTAMRLMDARGRDRGETSPPTAPDSVRRILPTLNPMAHPTVLMRRDVVLGVGGYRRAFEGAEDYDLWLRISERAELANLRDPLLRYRLHPDQTTWHHAEQRLLAELAALQGAQLREAGHADLGGGDAPADRTLLRRQGMADAAIASGLAHRADSAARAAAAIGQWDAAIAACRLVLAQPGLRLRTQLGARLRLAHWTRARRQEWRPPPSPSSADGSGR